MMVTYEMWKNHNKELPFRLDMSLTVPGSYPVQRGLALKEENIILGRRVKKLQCRHTLQS